MNQLKVGDRITPKYEQKQVNSGEKCTVEKIRSNRDGIVYFCGSLSGNGGFRISHKKLENAVSDGILVINSA